MPPSLPAPAPKLKGPSIPPMLSQDHTGGRWSLPGRLLPALLPLGPGHQFWTLHPMLPPTVSILEASLACSLGLHPSREPGPGQAHLLRVCRPQTARQTAHRAAGTGPSSSRAQRRGSAPHRVSTRATDPCPGARADSQPACWGLRLPEAGDRV